MSDQKKQIDELGVILDTLKSDLEAWVQYGEAKFKARKAIEALITQARLIELDLLEQAINTGWDMNEYKMHRLAELEASSVSTQ